ncbi:hypothetical protein P153DRAFT_287202 [Dothidotthia symphoricarpi CBS 119687]|uniref:Zn(2)-C6 fungal-type domain-containing protein n=1 Tax=Dothidotthia symphoricarpi CBS 119687 TaxID=1392245 RepID=A0A6A6AIE5_9PLEO|nr:uncharacterized protein P153DRAFT_287202 [Dothidotthia symphoricarpi CBS 119687]KAF2131003.1 hypothetical protein P153DRAFT_287202 [Dothidotthia symphoricarpi CBS 119687]
MSTSSQYYRSASTHSRYQNIPPNDHDQLYAANFAVVWQGQPYGGPSSVFTQGGVSSDFVTPSDPPAWSAAYPRQSFHGWAPRATYGDGGASAAVPQANHSVSRQYQASNTGSVLPQAAPENTFRSIDQLGELRVSSNSPANPLDPLFPNQNSTTHAVSRRPDSQSQTSLLNLNNSHVPSQLPAFWEVRSHVPPVGHHQYPDQISKAVTSSITTSGLSASSGTLWPTANPGESPSDTAAVYEQTHEQVQQWPPVQSQIEHGAFQHHQVQTNQIPEGTAHQQSNRRAFTKKKPARVPSSFVERQEKLKVSKRKGPLQDKQREKTHTMRKTKRICVRCRFYKSGCDEGDPCQKCDKIATHARSFLEPCYREHLEDTSLVRRCNGREHQEEAEFLGYDWIPGTQLYEMEVMWNLPGFGPISNAQPMRIVFRHYSPRRGSLDVAASVWSNTEGEVKAVEQPAYAIYDTANFVPAYERYFSTLQPAIEAWVFARIRQDEIASLTYQEVTRMRSLTGSKVLDLAMRLQCLSVVSQGYGTVWSNNIPGIQEYDYRRLGRSEYEAYDRNSCDRPLPGAITHQMDVAAVKYLKKLEKLFVKELAASIFKPRIKPWYELFLAFYVIFWNLEYVHYGAKGYIKSKNGTSIENQVNNVVSNQIKKWEFAFPVLLYHWRCTLRGYSPFKLARDNPEELRDRGHIDEEGFQYVTKIAHVFNRLGADRFQPPLTGFASAHYSMSSEWITKLFKEAGA